MPSPTPYDEAFYQEQQAASLRSAQSVLPLVFDLIHPKRIVDIGCGVGTWLKAASALGASVILGLDGDYVPRHQLLIPQERFQSTDISQPFKVDDTFDLAMNLEVAEHLPAAVAPEHVARLCALAPVVLFSAAIPFQGGAHHVNEQWPDYWAKLFAARDFVGIDCLRDRLWSNPDVESWYAQNSVLYVSKSRLTNDARLEAEHARSIQPLRHLVHPKLFLEHAETSGYGVRRSAKLFASSLATALRRRFTRSQSPG